MEFSKIPQRVFVLLYSPVKGVAMSLLLLLQLIFACNLRNASFLDRKLKSVKQVKESYAAHDMPVDINHL